jgi:hypothetical protein
MTSKGLDRQTRREKVESAKTPLPEFDLLGISGGQPADAEPEEVLVISPRDRLTPVQQVEEKLLALLRGDTTAFVTHMGRGLPQPPVGPTLLSQRVNDHAQRSHP